MTVPRLFIDAAPMNLADLQDEDFKRRTMADHLEVVSRWLSDEDNKGEAWRYTDALRPLVKMLTEQITAIEIDHIRQS